MVKKLLKLWENFKHSLFGFIESVTDSELIIFCVLVIMIVFCLIGIGLTNPDICDCCGGVK
jgi:hypothetical protein